MRWGKREGERGGEINKERERERRRERGREREQKKKSNLYYSLISRLDQGPIVTEELKPGLTRSAILNMEAQENQCFKKKNNSNSFH